MKVCHVFPLSGLILTCEDFGAIEPRKHKDILYRTFVSSMFPHSSQVMFVDFGEIKSRVTLDDVLGCKEIRLVEHHNGTIAVKIVEGNCFQRIG